MTREEFFEKFELFAELPCAVPKMRELVLELAATGRLLRQKDEEGTGREVLRRIRSSRKLPVPQIEPVRTISGYPPSWGIAALGEVTEVVRGVSFPGGAKSTVRAADNVACLRTASVQQEIDWDDLIYISPQYVTREEQWIRPRDIVISMANSYALVGKVAVVRQIPERTTFGAFLAVLRPIEVDPGFLLCALRAPLMQAAFRSSSSQTTNIANISLGRMRPLELPVPPLAEQKRIVAKVDELMALYDQLEAQQKERETRQAALARVSALRFAEAPTRTNVTYLCQNSTGLTAAELRNAIRTAAVRGAFTARSSAAAWPAVRLADVCTLITDGEHATPHRVATGVPLATAKNVRDGFLDIKHTDFVSESTARKCWTRCKPQHHDVLMVCVGATTGRVCVAIHPPDIVLVRSVALLRPNPERITPFFLDLFLRSANGQTQIWSNVKQSAQPCLYLGKIANLTLLLPPIAEQQRIIQKVDQLMLLIDRLDAQFTLSRGIGSRLLLAALDAFEAGEIDDRLAAAVS